MVKKNEFNGFNTNSIHTSSSSSTIFYSNQYFPNMSNSNTLSNKYRFQTWKYNRVYSGEKQCETVCQLDDVQRNEAGHWVSHIVPVQCECVSTWITSDGKLRCEKHSKQIDPHCRIPLLAKKEFDTHRWNMLLAAEAVHIPGKPILKLRDWIPQEEMDFTHLSQNENAIDLLEANMDKINWFSLALNAGAAHLLEANIQMFDVDCAVYFWKRLSINPSAIRLLEQNLKHVNWSRLSKNPAAVHLLHKYPQKIDMVTVWANPNVRDILRVLPEPFDKLLDRALLHDTKSRSNENETTWGCLASNPSPEIMAVLKKHRNKVQWDQLSTNPSAVAVQMLDENTCRTGRIDPHTNVLLPTTPYVFHPHNNYSNMFCANYNAMHLIKAHFSFLEYHKNDPDLRQRRNKLVAKLFANPGIFILDYAAMRDRMRSFAEELAAKAFHPQRIARWIEAGFEPDDW